MPDSAVALVDTVDANALLSVLAKIRHGDFTARMPLDWTGAAGAAAASLNHVITANEALAAELARMREVIGELGRQASKLTLSSRYKSEFLANISHELRTPLNSLLILASQLADNPDGNMTPTQIEYASVIHTSGDDLLTLLNGLLDLAKVESGTATIEMADMPVGSLCHNLLREFQPVARANGLEYAIHRSVDCPRDIVADRLRLRQILKNLLANAFKFTPSGTVSLHVGLTATGWNHCNPALESAPAVIAFAVADTGIGIDEKHHRRIFDEFAQVDGSTARIYGGTGLGLSISRELAALMGGDITLTSKAGVGSTFTVYLPVTAPVATSARREPVSAGRR